MLRGPNCPLTNSCIKSALFDACFMSLSNFEIIPCDFSNIIMRLRRVDSGEPAGMAMVNGNDIMFWRIAWTTLEYPFAINPKRFVNIDTLSPFAIRLQSSSDIGSKRLL